jgi:hypothetical protein
MDGLYHSIGSPVKQQNNDQTTHSLVAKFCVFSGDYTLLRRLKQPSSINRRSDLKRNAR